MPMFYDAATGGFYDDRIHKVIPETAVRITPGQHAKLLQAQAEGATIGATRGGNPKAVPHPVMSREDLLVRTIARVKAEAGRRIEAVAPVWRQLNDANLMASGTLTDAELAAVAGRRAAIDGIRAASGRIEAMVIDLDAAALIAFNLADDALWMETANA